MKELLYAGECIKEQSCYSQTAFFAFVANLAKHFFTKYHTDKARVSFHVPFTYYDMKK